jgi:hypothetical protein
MLTPDDDIRAGKGATLLLAILLALFALYAQQRFAPDLAMEVVDE